MSDEQDKVTEVTLDALRRVSLFQGCSQETLSDIRKKMVSKSFGRGAYIVKIGDIAQEMFFHYRGSGRVC